MKNSKSLVLGALLLAGCLASAGADAQTGPAGRGGFHGGRLFERLQLSDAQKSSIQNLFSANRENFRALREKMHEQRQRLGAATKSQPFDEAAVRFQAQELAKLQAEAMVQRAAVMNQVFSVLTPEQQAQLRDLREQRKARFQEWQERRRQRSGQQEG